MQSEKRECLKAFRDKIRGQNGGIGQGVAIHLQRERLRHLAAASACVGGFQLGAAFIHMKRAGKGEARVHA